MEEFKLVKFTEEGKKLLYEVTAEFNRLGLDASKLPKTFPDDNGKIKLVFVGQYSAGKSSLIKMLTGEDVAIGVAITTQDSKAYEWNGLEIIDTPGIHTELRPDHDEKAYYQINHAALLVFVITHAGFSQRIGNHFRKLAMEQKRIDNMVLVVNKMDYTARGNVPEQQQVIYEDLKKVTGSHDPKDLYLSFTDTASYFKALQEKDDRKKSWRLEQSGYDTFIKNLNRFVEDKGLLQKINLPLYTIAAEIQKASSLSLSDKEKEDLRAYKEIILHMKKIIGNGKKECLADIERILDRFKTDVSKRGREAAESATSKENPKDAETVLEAAKKEIMDYAQNCQTKIEECIKNFGEQTTLELKTYENSMFVQQVTRNISGKFTGRSASKFNQDGMVKFGSQQDLSFNEDKKFDGKFNIEGASEITQSVAGIAGTAGVAAGGFAFQFGAQIAEKFAEVAITPLGHIAGYATRFGVSNALSTVFQGADFGLVSGAIGKSAGNFVENLSWFKEEPTLVNKIASKFTGNGSKVFGTFMAIGGAAISAYSLYQEGKQAEKAEKKLQQVRKDIITNFDSFAKKIETRILDGEKKGGKDDEKGIRELMNQNIEPFIAELDKAVDDIDVLTSGDIFKSQKLSALLKQTEKLIDEIQACR